MSERGFVSSEAFKEYARCLARLHELIATDRDDSPEGDALRDRMDGPWSLLTEEECEQVNGLAQDLNSILKPASAPLPSNPQFQRNREAYKEAGRRGEWDKVLAILRRWEKYFAADELAALRGSAWSQAGELAIATQFYRRAWNLDPNNEIHAALYLTALGNSDIRSTLEQADSILENQEKFSLSILYHAAVWSFLAATVLEGADVKLACRRAIPVFLQMLENPTEESRHSPPRTVFSFLIHAYECIGEREKALDCLNHGLAIAPDDDSLLLWKGIYRYGSDPNDVSFFSELLKKNENSLCPYYFLAHHSLVNHEPDACRNFCIKGLRLDPPDVVKSELFEWLAMATAELGFPREDVRSAFHEASRLAPLNERIRQNLEIYERESASGVTANIPWRIPSNAEVQEAGERQSLGAEFRRVRERSLAA